MASELPFYTKSYWDSDIVNAVNRAFFDVRKMLYGLGFPEPKREWDYYVAGGAVTCLYQKEPQAIKDWDFYFKDEKLKDVYLSRFKELGVGQHKMLDIMCITDYAVSFKKLNAPKYPYYQFITKYTGPGDDIVSHFDFFHCMAYASAHSVYGHKEFGECAEGKLLRCNTYYNREISGPRVKKFLKRGYRFETDEEKGLKLLRQLGVDKNGNADS